MFLSLLQLTGYLCVILQDVDSEENEKQRSKMNILMCMSYDCETMIITSEWDCGYTTTKSQDGGENRCRISAISTWKDIEKMVMNIAINCESELRREYCQRLGIRFVYS